MITYFGAGLAKGFSNNIPDWSLPISLYTFKFTEISKDFVQKELKHLENYSKLDVCNMDTRLLNIAAPVITPSLHFLLNWSLFICYVYHKTGRLPKLPLYTKVRETTIWNVIIGQYQFCLRLQKY